MTLKRTMIFLDPGDHRALFNLALDESRKQGRRVTMAEMIRQAVRTYLRDQPVSSRLFRSVGEAAPRPRNKKPER